MILTERNWARGEQNVVVLVCTLKIPHGMSWDGTRLSRDIDYWLIAWLNAWPYRAMAECMAISSNGLMHGLIEQWQNARPYAAMS